MKLKLEKLLKEGWVKIQSSTNYAIYGAKDSRVLYNKTKKEIVGRYRVKEEQNNIPKLN